MGLDMYLNGKKYLWHNWKQPEKDLKEDGFRLEERVLKLGYWRKHPNLHGYIVQYFGDGRDECQEIELEEDELRQILIAVKSDDLPKTEGFFFGESRSEDKQPTIEILERAIQWLLVKEPEIWKSVTYRASW